MLAIQTIYGGTGESWFGEGCIDKDPVFVDPDNGNFHLSKGSPCINAGDPKSPLDLDNTIFDMGAFYFPQGPESKPEIKVIYPNGNEKLQANSKIGIKWESKNLERGRIKILFYNGSEWSKVIDNLPLTKTSYMWNVPDKSLQNCKIRVGNYDTKTDKWIVYDDSDSFFVVIPNPKTQHLQR